MTDSAPGGRVTVALAGGAAIAAGAGLAYFVARAGEPHWQILRALVIVALTAIAWRAVTSDRPVVRAATATCAGVVSAPVGLAIAAPHLSKVGVTSMSVVGTVTALAGLILLVLGVTGLVRAAPGWWRLPVACGLIVMLYVVEPSIAFAIAATNVPATEVGAATPASLGLEYEDVTFAATDGTELSGWYLESTNGAAVALLHGAGSTRSAVLEHAAVLARNGYGVLLYDARGHGRSAGQAMDFGWYGDEDLGGAVTFLQAQPEVDPERVGAVGLSMGGEQAIGAMAGIDDLRAVVAEGVTGRVAEDKSWYSAQYGARGSVQEGIEWLTTEVTDLLTAADEPMSLRSAIEAAAPRPVLLIAAGEVADEGDAGAYLQLGSPSTVQLWTAEDAGHTEALARHPQAWEERVVAFLDRALR
jgi:pimeloyl-ACP methyl ester carboxylesterase